MEGPEGNRTGKDLGKGRDMSKGSLEWLDDVEQQVKERIGSDTSDHPFGTEMMRHLIGLQKWAKAMRICRK